MGSAHITPMAGTLKTWHEDRGFGFIRPDDGGRDLFVHISAFSPGASRPTVGEKLQFDLGAGRDGRPQALRVRRPGEVLREVNHLVEPTAQHATVRPTGRSHVSATGAQGRSSYRHHAGSGSAVRRNNQPGVPGWLVMLLLAMLAVGFVAYGLHLMANRPPPGPSYEPVWPDVGHRKARTSHFQCDGRRHCSQMSSCEEAIYFLQNCPGTEMDGDGDGVPCEQQWCVH